MRDHSCIGDPDLRFIEAVSISLGLPRELHVLVFGEKICLTSINRPPSL
ncbi:MAG: hypothetical protein ACR2O0_02580 [Rhizobiaceae bacterium]